jgi:hypothetical protein
MRSGSSKALSFIRLFAPAHLTQRLAADDR